MPHISGYGALLQATQCPATHPELAGMGTVACCRRYRDSEELREAFASAGVDISREVVFSCGTGVTASILALALHVVDPGSAPGLYDGSWTEWAGRGRHPARVMRRRAASPWRWYMSQTVGPRPATVCAAKGCQCGPRPLNWTTHAGTSPVRL